MSDTRNRRAILNIFVSLGAELITLICGLIVPRLLLNAFGSEAYGATSSISQFLGYITLLEGGIGGVARAAFYKPLAENDQEAISKVFEEIKRFFRALAMIFIPYVIVLAFAFPDISHVQVLDRASTGLLVIVISISTFTQYFIGISYSVLLQAAQKTYITKIVNISGTLLNAVLVVLLVKLGCSLILVKFVSSLVFAVKPFILAQYVHHNYKLERPKEREKKALEQKWAGLGQHLAYFLHSHTDVVVLTILTNLTNVAIYSVYQMIISNIQTLTVSFSTGMEAIFGDMLVRKEKATLEKTFGYYESLISIISVILFGTTTSLIIPFIRLYTSNVTDADYIQPLFAVILTLSSVIYCLRMPYHAITIAAGHFKQTQIAAYGEAFINITLSIVLVLRYQLVGVAIGTLVATSFRFIFYVIYLSKNIFNRPIALFIKRMIVNGICFIIVLSAGKYIVLLVDTNNYMLWILCGIIVTFVATAIVLIVYKLFYSDDIKFVMRKIGHRKK